MHSAASSALQSPIAAVIVGCEIGFWALVLTGLVLRYIVRAERASTATFFLLPVLDIVLLVAVAIDLHRGADVTAVHGLATIYLGVTVAFAHSMIAWADRWFAFRFAGGPRPPKPPKKGVEGMKYELMLFGRWIIATIICSAALGILIVTVASDKQADDLIQVFGLLGIVTVIWLLTGPVWNLFGGGFGSKNSSADTEK